MSEPVFKTMFGETWDTLPPAMKRRYEVRPSMGDRVRMTGYLKVSMAWPYRLISPLMRLSGMLIPNIGKFPAYVDFETNLKNNRSHLIRYTETPKGQHVFNSYWMKNGEEIVEVLAFGFCWRANYAWDGTHMNITHRGYAVKLGNKIINLPLTWLFGRGDAQETPLSDDSFEMFVTINHPLWGELYRYEGEFKLEEPA